MAIFTVYVTDYREKYNVVVKKTDISVLFQTLILEQNIYRLRKIKISIADRKIPRKI